MAWEGEEVLQNEIHHLHWKTRGMSEQIDKAAAIHRQEYQKVQKSYVGCDVTTDRNVSLTPRLRERTTQVTSRPPYLYVLEDLLNR